MEDATKELPLGSGWFVGAAAAKVLITTTTGEHLQATHFAFVWNRRARKSFSLFRWVERHRRFYHVPIN